MTIMGMSLQGCCTSAGTCGIDTTAFGMPGCTDISMFSGGMAKPCSGDADGGTAEDAGN
jgi:hypothetical protein